MSANKSSILRLPSQPDVHIQTAIDLFAERMPPYDSSSMLASPGLASMPYAQVMLLESQAPTHYVQYRKEEQANNSRELDEHFHKTA